MLNIFPTWVGINVSYLGSNLKPTKIYLDANLNQHALRPNKQYWNICPRKLKFRFFIENPDLTSINEMRTKGMKCFCYLFPLLGLCTLDLKFRGVDVAF